MLMATLSLSPWAFVHIPDLGHSRECLERQKAAKTLYGQVTVPPERHVPHPETPPLKLCTPYFK